LSSLQELEFPKRLQESHKKMSNPDFSSDEFSDDIAAEDQNGNGQPRVDLDLSPVYSPSEVAEETRSADNISDTAEFSRNGSIQQLSEDEEVFNESEMRLHSPSGTLSINAPFSSFSRHASTMNSSTMTTSFEPLAKFDEAPPLQLPSKTKLKIRIKRLNVCGEWRWKDGNGDNCGICRAPFEGCCVDCKMPGEECPLVLGVCKHPFHMHCIVKWTNAQSNQQKPACPLCRQEWKFAS
jgi:anaphase-promoting complex subunit 11